MGFEDFNNFSYLKSCEHLFIKITFLKIEKKLKVLPKKSKKRV